jgi:hypothetical protein
MMRQSHRLLALVHHSLALETGLSAAQSAQLRASEQAALLCARHVVATSAATVRILAAEYALPSERLSVVEPGTDAAVANQRQAGSGRYGKGTVTPSPSGRWCRARAMMS